MEKGEVKDILSHIKFLFYDYVDKCMEQLKKVVLGNEKTLLHLYRAATNFGKACGFCTTGRSLAEQHDGLSFEKAEEYFNEECPLQECMSKMLKKIKGGKKEEYEFPEPPKETSKFPKEILDEFPEELYV